MMLQISLIPYWGSRDLLLRVEEIEKNWFTSSDTSDCAIEPLPAELPMKTIYEGLFGAARWGFSF
jgi:hypothetical protein